MEKPLIVVTGGTRGIGNAIAVHFAKEGYDIATCARTPEALGQMKDTFTTQYRISVFVCVADLSIRAEAKEFVEFVKRLKRPIKVLVNNAGLFANGPLLKEGKGVMEQIMAANFYSAYWVATGLVEKVEGHGYIFNICSIASTNTSATGGSYFIAKQALYGFTKALCEELRPLGIKVTAVLPSATFTSSWDGSGMNPERLMNPTDIAQTIWDATQLSPLSSVEEIVLRPPLGDLI